MTVVSIDFWAGKVFACQAEKIVMKRNLILYGSLLWMISFLSSCEIVGGIFKAGVWVGILIVVAIIGLIVWLVGRGRG
jgi:hypothetical protein